MKYKTGDKFIIEIEKTGKTLAKIKGFRTLVFDDYGLDKLEQVQEHDGCDGCEYRWTPKANEIQVGDEVENEIIGCKAVVWQIKGKNMRIMRKDNGELVTSWWIKEGCTRTGKTYPELIKALEELPKEGE